MKRLLIALTAALSFWVQAEPIGYIPNEAGGQIIFTSEICQFKGENYIELRRVFSFNRSGGVLEGCYYFDRRTDLLMVVWADGGDRSVFPLGNVRPF